MDRWVLDGRVSIDGEFHYMGSFIILGMRLLIGKVTDNPLSIV